MDVIWPPHEGGSWSQQALSVETRWRIALTDWLCPLAWEPGTSLSTHLRSIPLDSGWKCTERGIVFTIFWNSLLRLTGLTITNALIENNLLGPLLYWYWLYWNLMRSSHLHVPGRLDPGPIGKLQQMDRSPDSNRLHLINCGFVLFDSSRVSGPCRSLPRRRDLAQHADGSNGTYTNLT